MSADFFMFVIGVGATVVCTVIAIAVIPGLTVVINRTLALREDRAQLLQLLNDCEQTAKRWVHTTDQERWERGRNELWHLYYSVGEIKTRLPVIGGGESRSATIIGEGAPIGQLQHLLQLMVWNSESAGPTVGQREARKRDLENLKRHSRDLRDLVNDLESTKALRSHVWTEVCQVYYSIWRMLVGWFRMLFAKS